MYLGVVKVFCDGFAQRSAKLIAILFLHNVVHGRLDSVVAQSFYLDVLGDVYAGSNAIDQLDYF